MSKFLYATLILGLSITAMGQRSANAQCLAHELETISYPSYSMCKDGSDGPVYHKVSYKHDADTRNYPKAECRPNPMGGIGATWVCCLSN